MSSSASSVNSFRSAREEHSPNSTDGTSPDPGGGGGVGVGTGGGPGSPITTGTRQRLPVRKSDVNNTNFWSFLKQCIGRELSKITMPVQWNEPLSFLQRLSEYMNYAYLLDVASSKQDAADRLKYVATFAVSSLAANIDRMGKPFNPLLGETYELKGHGFRIVCEQVKGSTWKQKGTTYDIQTFKFRSGTTLRSQPSTPPATRGTSSSTAHSTPRSSSGASP